MKMKKFILFLNNSYPAKDNQFYLELTKSRIKIAVDGGLRFFIRNKIKPDLLIGDLDSIPRVSQTYLSGIKTLIHPSKKNKTDSELALEYALENLADDIIICGAISESQIDHTLGNIFLLRLISNSSAKASREINARIASPQSEIYLLNDSGVEIKGKKGDIVSILPLPGCDLVAYSNLDYPAPKEPIECGSSRTLRNRMIKSGYSVR
ncbi:MAG: thiamine diphosphokinase, partial [Candidatus Zixiibacteriota bacterium]